MKTPLSLLLLGIASTLLLTCSMGCSALPKTLPLTASFSKPLPEIFWGYTREHPLPMPSVLKSVEYLDQLRNPDGSIVQWNRLGAEYIPDTTPLEDCPHQTPWVRFKQWLGFEHQHGTILDRYALTTPRGVIILWVNPYAKAYPKAPPKGFILAPNF